MVCLLVGSMGQGGALRLRRRRGTILDQFGKWQAATCPGAISRSAGASALHRAWARGQRGWKWQPLGGWIGLGTSPCSTMR
jgi:hypothetical protein